MSTSRGWSGVVAVDWMASARARPDRIVTTAAEIATALDGRRTGNDAWVARCPAHSDAEPSLSVTERDGKTLLFCHAGCSQSDVIAALRARGLWSTTRQKRSADTKPAALRIWNQCKPAADTIVETYLRSRSIELAMVPAVLRFHSALRYEDTKQTLPALVAGVQDVSGSVVAIHRTYLRPDGSGKAEIARVKRMLGPVAGGAVRLTEAGQRLAIAEGIETALSVHVATQLPTWAALSAPGIAGLQLPALPIARDVIVATDADDDGASMRAAHQAAARWNAEGRRVLIAAALSGKDFNDVLRENGVERVRQLLDAAQEVQTVDTGRVPVLVRMCDVQPESVQWLWRPRLPLGKLSLLTGDPGIGKGFLVAAIVAAVTTGARWPDGGECEAGAVVLLNAEDGAADTLRPRLDAAGADVSRVHLLAGYRDDADQQHQQRYVTLQDVDVLRATLAAIRPRFVSVDPVQAFLGAKVDMHRANEVRPVLAALAKLAEEYRCAILCTAHLTKGGRDRALYRALGSIDFVAAARSMLLVGLDPEDPSRRALAQVKPTAWAPRATTLLYTIEENRVLWSSEQCELTAEMLVAPDAVALDKRTKIAEAVTFLERALAQGPCERSELLRKAHNAGLEEHHIERAKRKLHIIIEGVGFPRRTTWRLAAAERSASRVSSVSCVSTDSDDSPDSTNTTDTHTNTRARERATNVEVVEV